jgi:hypothetical protein
LFVHLFFPSAHLPGPGPAFEQTEPLTRGT